MIRRLFGLMCGGGGFGELEVFFCMGIVGVMWVFFEVFLGLYLYTFVLDILLGVGAGNPQSPFFTMLFFFGLL